MNKKGVIGTTMAWIIALFIIVFILAIFLVITFLLADKFISSSPNIDVNENDASVSLSQTNNLINFIEVDRELIYDWADDDSVLLFIDWQTGKTDDKMNAICNEIDKNKDVFGLDKNRIYFMSGNEGFIVEINEEGFICRIIPPNQEGIIGQINSQVFIFSDKDNKIRIANVRK